MEAKNHNNTAAPVGEEEIHMVKQENPPKPKQETPAPNNTTSIAEEDVVSVEHDAATVKSDQILGTHQFQPTT